MKDIRVAEGVVPLGEFKAHAARYLKQLDGPVIITQNGRATGVLVSPGEYDRMREQQRFLESLAIGLSDAQSERTLETDELRERLNAARLQRQSR
ncbi:type II toxin-antitoxin system Phd/YefM family antitoxin [Geoalkalibacter sp.]|uniref:type II toxin-antitoxin system Phd/YefM family antitoxin n=1 Tax=Geoalkalibacter sp. TaxID=3041440 RepID=UPI00272ECAA3|nr:type II toxin-antitoxin system Phd/YefM family antitoxin [Geoalkalibacter sp.]